MYLSFYKLDKKPFQISADPMFLWMGEKHKEALAMLRYGIMDNRGFIMLTGDVGTGKTTLINALKETLGSNVTIAGISNPGLEKLEFLNYLSAAFGMKKSFRNKGEFLLGFKDFLEKSYRDGKQVLLIVDEAQRLSQEMLEEIRLLSNIERQDVKLLNIFFVGQDELNGILDRHENRALRQRMTLHYHLEPLAKDEIGEFIEHRLKVAGAISKIFSKEAINEIYTFSNGYPRLTNIICDHAMLAGYVANKKNIGPDEIRECAKDLKLPKINFSPQPVEPHAPETMRPTEKPKPEKEKSYFYLLPYVTGFLLAVLLICFLYFPIRAGASFSDILNYWMDQIRQPDLAISKPITGTPVPQATYKVNDAGQLDGWAAGQQKRLEAKTLGGDNVPTTGSSTGTPGGTEEGKSGEAEDPKIRNSEGKTTTGQLEVPPSSQATQLPGSLSSQHHSIPASQLSVPDSEKRYTLTFDFDSNDLTQEGYEQLDKTAAAMRDNPGINLIIEGHTDSVGSKAYNVMLSKFRADIVKNYLVTKGIDSERINSIGKGAEDPLASNNDSWGRHTNRRVEVEMVF